MIYHLANKLVMKKSLFTFFLLLTFLISQAGIPTKPNPPRLVNDLAGIFTKQQVSQLEKDLVNFSKSTTTQIVVVTVKSLEGYDKASFTYEIGEKWGVGDKKFDNGVVLMIKPKEFDGKGETFIATGYGLEGIIPDAVTKRIVEVEMIPWFKKKNYFNGTVSALNKIKSLALKEYAATDYLAKTKKKRRKGTGLSVLGFLAIAFLIFIFKVRQVRSYSRSNGMAFWAAWMLLNQSNRSHRGGYSNFSSGSSGFGGFGGGSFGGGGAGGSW